MKISMHDHSLTERAQRVLRELMKKYIRDGQPVGSQSLAQSGELSLSAASIRSVMADLEAKGLLRSPHTSAGRVPTDDAFRLFVNTLLTVQPIEQAVLAACQAAIDANDDQQALAPNISKLLSQMTNLASLVTVPKPKQMLLRHVEFLPLSEQRLLIILVLNEKEVHNRIIHVDKNYTTDELNRLSKLLVEAYGGQALSEVRKSILDSMEQDWQMMDKHMRHALLMANRVLDAQSDMSNYVMSGEANLFSIAQEKGAESLRELLETFAEQQEMLKLIDRCLRADGVQIFIGRDSSCDALVDCSVVAAPYSNEEGDLLGLLGVIGPRRMDYEKVVPIVDVTARLLSSYQA